MLQHLVRGAATAVTVPALVIAVTTLVVGQSDRPAAPTPWAVPRTPAGHPDFQGVWTNYDSTPFERPAPGDVAAERLVVSTAEWLVQPGPRSAVRASMVV